MSEPGSPPEDKARRLLRRLQLRVARRLPPGGRLVAGLLLVVGGVFGFLPVLGFWMIPLGLAIAALDARRVCRTIRWRRRRDLARERQAHRRGATN